MTSTTPKPWIHLTVKNPKALYAWWSPVKTEVASLRLCLRGARPEVTTHHAVPSERRWAILGCVPRVVYRVDLEQEMDGEWSVLAASRPVTSPPPAHTRLFDPQWADLAPDPLTRLTLGWDYWRPDSVVSSPGHGS